MSAIDDYLDSLFDRLSGTGAAGRRAFAEAEDHLRSAAATNEETGMSTDEAEVAAVASFGTPHRIVRLARQGSEQMRRLRMLVSGGWLFAALAATMLGITYAARGVDIAALLRMHPEPYPACGPFVSGQVCSETVPQLHRFTAAAIIVLGAAVVLWVSRWLCVRYGVLSPIGPITSFACAAGLLLLAAVVHTRARGEFQFDGGPGFQFGFVLLVAAGAMTVAMVVWGLAKVTRARA